jgi:hypothetical protein
MTPREPIPTVRSSTRPCSRLVIDASRTSSTTSTTSPERLPHSASTNPYQDSQAVIPLALSVASAPVEMGG